MTAVIDAEHGLAAALATAAQLGDPAWGALALLAALAAATLVSEDLACVAAGLLVARGALGFAPASLACLAGIYAGDLLLYAAGRVLGRAALARWPADRLASPAAIARASTWIERRGATAVALSRVVPGMRLPTYLAAGLLDTGALRFAAYLFVAAALWTPALVGIAALAGSGSPGWVAARVGGDPARAAAAAGALAIALVGGLRVTLPLLTWRGRRLALGRWRRLRHWEFWPLAVVYVPIVLWIARLAVRHRSLTLATAANPGIPGGGFAGESKIEILRALAGAPEHALRTALVPTSLGGDERAALAEAFVAEAELAWPVVVKPDVSERGAGVVFARSPEELRAAVAAAPADVLVQEHAAGAEFGIFWVRDPDADRGRVVSITEKLLPSVRGDGRRTLEELILADERAVCMARTHLERFADRLDEVPAPGEEVALVSVGTHSRGAVFRDGRRFLTAELEAAIERVSRCVPGFHFGRYDVRVASADDLRAGRGFKVLELNGLTAEPTHVYDPDIGVLAAYRVLLAHWTTAFEIGRKNRERGARPATLRELARLVRRARRHRG